LYPFRSGEAKLEVRIIEVISPYIPLTPAMTTGIRLRQIKSGDRIPDCIIATPALAVPTAAPQSFNDVQKIRYNKSLMESN
jgi:hypothetical protein